MIVSLGRDSLITANLLLATGITQHFTLKWETLDENDEKQQVDLSTWTVLSQIRDYRHELILDLSSHVDVSHGVLDFLLPASAMKDLKAGSGKWDVILTSPAGVVVRFLSGTVDIRSVVSKETA